MPTTNPVPSNDPTDLLFNAQKLDQVVNGSAQYYTDRLGHSRRTLSALEAEFPNAAANAASATTQAGIATTQAGIATTQAGIATTQAQLATTNGAAQVTLATQQVALANTAKTAAETARDAAFVNANVYADTAAGLAATTNGQQFQVVSGGEIIRYRNNSGSAVEVARYPKGGFQRYMGIANTSTIPEVATNNYYVANTPGTYTNFSGLVVGNEIANLRYNGSVWVKETVVSRDSNYVEIGEVVSGLIYPEYNSGVANTSKLIIAENTKVHVKKGFNTKVITLTPQTIILNTTDHSGTLYMYCSMSGTVYLTTVSNPKIPSGDWVLIAYTFSNQSGNNAWGFSAFAPFYPTNHMLYGGPDVNPGINAVELRSVNVKDFGFLGDGTDETSKFYALYNLLNLCVNQNKYSGNGLPEIYFPPGTYGISATAGAAAAYNNFKIVGKSKTETIIKFLGSGTGFFVVSNCENITLHNIRINSDNLPGMAVFKNVEFKFDADKTGGATYCVTLSRPDVFVSDCTFNYLGSVYIPLWVNNYRSAVIERNVFNPAGTGYASHAVRIESPSDSKQNVVVRQNKVNGGTTGIFFASGRVRPIANCLVELNELNGQVEESISFDGFGNNPGLCPVICNGLITSATNDANGRLVITAAMKYHNGSTPNVDCPVSTRTDWTNFYFSLDEGSGREGTVARIVSADSATNAFTLETRTPAASIAIGGWCGVQSGFFDCAIRNNVISGSVGNGPDYNYATALSIYLNVFNFTIDGNTVIGCAHGVNIAGGIMLSTYRALSYNNVVKNNRFLSCGERSGGDAGVVRFESYYGTVKQYNNQFINNVIQGGKVGVYMRHQANLIYENNVVDHVDAFDWRYCGNTLPTANATQIGRTFMKITDDGSGNPTTIEYYVCKLSGGAYTWVAV